MFELTRGQIFWTKYTFNISRNWTAKDEVPWLWNTTLAVVFTRSHECNDINIDTASICLFNWGQIETCKNSKLTKLQMKMKMKILERILKYKTSLSN